VAWLDARSRGGRFVLRMEDLDGPRVVEGAARRILEDLAALGLDWDEGARSAPGGDGLVDDGPDAPYEQSRRGAIYEVAAARLVALGRAFPCWCSRAEVARASTAPHGPSDEGPRYPGTCREIDPARRAALEAAGRRPSLRFRVDENERVLFSDRVHGEVESTPARECGDFVIRRSDGLWAYQLAVVVDDGAMGVTDVVRGDDLLASTGRQILLQRALGLATPRYAHLPLVLGPDGQRLSKRHGSIAVRALFARGLAPARVVGILAASLGLVEPGAAPAASELLAGFSLDRVARDPVRLDPEALA
jgi:glutamyl-tRNA synthetase